MACMHALIDACVSVCGEGANVGGAAAQSPAAVGMSTASTMMGRVVEEKDGESGAAWMDAIARRG